MFNTTQVAVSSWLCLRLRGCPRKNCQGKFRSITDCPDFFQWKIAILSHEEISHLFGPTQFFLYFTGRFSRPPKTSQFAIGSGAVLVKF